MSGHNREHSGGSARDEIHTVVVGGGQAGLAAGYHLARRGVPFVILDSQTRIGDTWRNRWDSLRLFTTARYSGLPGLPFPGSPTAYPTKDEAADYLEAYAEHFHLPVRSGVRVDRLTRTGDRYHVICDDHSLLADNVVVASGPYHRPRIPLFADGLDRSIVQLHSREYRNPSQLQDGGVLVVGAANSGAEIAIEVAGQQPTWLSGRDPGQEPTRAGTVPDRMLMPLIWFVATRVLTVNTPMGRKVRDQFLDPPRGIPLGRVRRKDFEIAGVDRVARTSGVRDGFPQLADGRVLNVSNVIWCTGFTPGFDWIDLPVPMHDGVPIHDRGVVGSSPGLYLLGLLFQHSLSSALLGGVGRDAEHVVGHLATRGAGRSREMGGRPAAR